MDERNKTEVTTIPKKVIFSPRDQERNPGIRIGVREYLSRVMSDLRKYQERERLYKEVQDEVLVKNERIGNLETEAARLTEEVKRLKGELEEAIKKEHHLLNQQAKREQELSRYQAFQQTNFELEEHVKCQLQIASEQKQQLDQVTRQLQLSEDKFKQELLEKQEMLMEKENVIACLEKKEHELEGTLNEQEHILHSLKKERDTCEEYVGNLKEELQMQHSKKDKGDPPMGKRKSWFNWSGSREENREKEVQLLLKSGNEMHRELENVKAQLQHIMAKIEGKDACTVMQEEQPQDELQSLKMKAAELKAAIVNKEEEISNRDMEILNKDQEINALKEREKSYLKQIQQFTTNLAKMQQKSKTIHQNPVAKAGAPSNHPLAANHSPFLKNHQVPPNFEDYFKNL